MMAKESKGRWGNCIRYVLIPLKIGLEKDPLDYVRKAKATIDPKKLSLEALCTYSIAQFVINIFGFKVPLNFSDPCIHFLYIYITLIW